MSWLEDMKADAAQVAFGEQAEPGDEVEFSVEYDPGYAYSSYTYEDPEFKISVDIPARQLHYTTWSSGDAQEFMQRLLELGAKRAQEAA